MHNKQVILFDLDGTLTDSALGIINGARKGLEWFGVQEPDQDKLYKFIGPPLLESYQTFYGMTPQQAEEAVKVYREYYSVTGLFENRVYDGIPALLQDLRAAGKTLAVATSKPETFSLRILEKFDLAKYFHYIAGASLDTSRANKSAVVAHALGLCGHPAPETVVMVGDRMHDVEGANNNGLQSIGVLYGYGDRAELEKEGATVIAESVEQLRNILLK